MHEKKANDLVQQAYLKGYRGRYGLYQSNRGGANTDHGTKTVRVNINELKRGVYDDFGTLGSVISHEANPNYGHKSENINPAKYTYLDHSKVYLGQALDSDFKNSSLDNQVTTAIGFAERIFATTQKEQGLNVSDYIKQFNANNGRVSIDDINTNNGNMTYTIDGQISDTKKLIIPLIPQD